MNVGSLFSGIGGLDLGFEREGFELLWFSETNPFRKEVLRKTWPGKKNFGDIRKIRFEKLGSPDFLVGGFPCQDLSKAGKRRGIAGPQSGLWKEFYKAIGILRPRYAVIENVPNLAGWFELEPEPAPGKEEIRLGKREVEIEQYQGLQVVLADLAEIRYDAEWFCLRASDFGAFHPRQRIFIVAYPCIDRGFAPSQKRPVPPPKIYDSDSWRQRIEGFTAESLQGEQGFSWCKGIRGVEDFKGRPDIPEPLVRGKNDGLSSRSYYYRINALGDAVVPQVAQFVAHRIKEAEGGLK